jgi:hypothetical protein
MIKKKHYKKISRTIDRFQKQLGLTDWEITWAIGDEHSYVVRENCLASVHFNQKGRSATIAISPFSSIEHVEHSVVHEMIHLMLADLEALIPEDIDSEAQCHSAIRRIENIVLKGLK